MKMLRLLIVGALCGTAVIDGVGLSTKYLKGTYTVVREDKKHLSPAWGCNWYMLGVPKNMYRYGPQASPTIMLVKELFNYYPDERILRPTNSPSKIAYYFTPSLIGAIIGQIENESLASKEEKKEEQSLAERIETILNENLKNAAQWQEQLKKQTQKNLDELKKQYKSVQKKIDNAQKSVSKAKSEEAKEEFEQGIQENKQKLVELSMQIDAPKAFSQLIANSIQEIKKGDYLEHTTHWILLSFLWAKAESKQAILEYFDAFNPAIAIIGDRKAWVEGEYTQENYIKLQQWLVGSPESMMDVKEAALFFSCTPENKFSTSTEIMPYKPLGYLPGIKFEKNNQRYEFSDCGESATRDFINTMLYNPETKDFDFSRLKASSLNPAQGLLDYYKAYSTIEALSTREAHNAWAQVVADLPGITYKKGGVCEITGGLPPVLKLLNHLLFGNDPEFDKKTNSQKVQYIFDSFSSKESPITWSEKDNKDINNITIDVLIQFVIAEKFSYEWVFKTGHYYLQSMYSGSRSRSSTGRDPIFQFLKNKADDQFCFNIITWYISQNYIWSDRQNFMKLVQKKNNVAMSNQFFYMQNLDDEQHKVSFLRHMSYAEFTPSRVLVSNLVKSEAVNEGAYIRLIESLLDAKSQVHKDILKKEIVKIPLIRRIQIINENLGRLFGFKSLFTVKEVIKNFDEIKKDVLLLKDVLRIKSYGDDTKGLLEYLIGQQNDATLIKAFLLMYTESFSSKGLSITVNGFKQYIDQLEPEYLIYLLNYVFEEERVDLYSLINRDLVDKALQVDRDKLISNDPYFGTDIDIKKAISPIALNKIEALYSVVSLRGLCASSALSAQQKTNILQSFLESNALTVDQQEVEKLDEECKKLFIDAVKKTQAQNYYQYLPKEDQQKMKNN